PLRVVRLDRADAADTRTDRDAQAMRVRFGDFDSRIRHRLHTRGDAVVHEGVALACFFGLEVLADIEIADRTREARGERARVEVVDHRDAADTVTDVVPA